MSTKYFKNFEKIYYQFGDENYKSLFQNISQYADIFDQVKAQQTFYEDYTIKSGDRPDTLSLQLYGDPKYYWTFYLLNDDLRESGWPLKNEELLSRAKDYYPHRVVTTTDILASETESYDFSVGKQIFGQVSDTVGTIVKRNLDLGQLIIDTTNAFTTEQVDFTLDVNTNGAADIVTSADNKKFDKEELWVLQKYPAGSTTGGVIMSGHDIVLESLNSRAKIRSIAFEQGFDYVLTATVNTFNNDESTFLPDESLYIFRAGNPVFIRLHKETAQYNAIHHYEDADGNYVDVDPFSESRSSSLKAVTNFERLTEKNDSLKQIKVLKKSSVDSVVKEFHRLMKQR